jgi:hypothetical protein
MKSSFLNLNKTDFIKGLIMAVLTSVLTIVYNTISTGSFAIDLKAVSLAASTSAVAYIMKNILTNSNDQFLKKEA